MDKVILETLNSGGWILKLLILMSVGGLTCLVYRIFCFLKATRELNSTAQSLAKKVQASPLQMEFLRAELDLFLVRLESGILFLRILASTSPLLGLLGTVLGLLEAFDAVARMGLGEPGVFAGGISKALITTVGGLIVAIPNLLGVQYLERWSDKIGARLEAEVLNQLHKEP